MDRLSNAVRLYYHELWYPLYGFIDKHETITGFSEHFDSSEPAVSKQRILDFCQNVNSSADYYRSGSSAQWPLPIEFAYFVSFPGTIRTLTVPAVGNYHPVFVPLYHRIELISEKELFCSDTEMRLRHSVDELFNTSAGKQIKISSVVCCNDKPVARTSTAFLGIGGFVETAKSFSKTYDQNMLAWLPTREDVKALELKEWFSYISDKSPRIAPGSLLEFCFDSVCRFQDTGVYSSVTTTGSAVLLQANGQRVHIANIGLQTEIPCTSNPVVDFLQQYATTDGTCVFANGGIPMDLPESTVSKPHITVTESLDEFATISSDYNPVHVNPYYAGLKGIPGIVAHAIWVGAATRAVVNRHVLEGDSDRVRSLTVKVAALVSPRDKLSVSVRHIGMANGLIQAQAITTKLDSTPVLICDLAIEQPKTAYVFTGQQDVPAIGTGMSLYEKSDSAKHVWDCADRYMLEEYGISLLDVVRNNPESVNVNFEGDKGCRVLEKYTTFLTRDCLDEHQQYTFKSPDGVLELLQFSQLVYAVDAMANIADMRSKGLVQKGALFAGCGLGEVTALASLGCGLLSVEGAVDITFHRGLLMQQSVIKDENRHLSEATKVGVEDALLHSSKMLPHVESIRNKLQTHIHASNVDLSALQHCYVPSLTGKPFELSKSYVEHAYKITQSAILKRVIDGWQSVDLDHLSEKNRVAIELLIELLAFQMVYPAQSSSAQQQQQQQIFKEQNVRRLIEVSSNHSHSYEISDDSICHLHVIRDRKALYYDQCS
ncbi:fatty acid synthase alpha subunit Lsd1 [Coemansia sp. RSA 2559]|nr:fatty acid synthase alpha subunit Lsd1 [Coemansia sp. RSA 2559]